MRRVIGLVVLGVSCSLAVYLFLNNPDAHIAMAPFGSKPAATTLATPYQTEQEWATGEIVSDINEMARYRSTRAGAPTKTSQIVPWQPELFTDYAAQQFAGSARSATTVVDPRDQYRVLVDLSADVLVRANVDVSAALKRDMNNPRAHEAAALVLGAFAMREAAGGMSDVRWAMNRITAHLAVAAALRTEPSSMSEDGQLANAALMILSNHRRDAGAALAAMPAVPRVEFAAWQRALKIRNTEDWRLLAEPAKATRLEKLEYFRARRITMKGLRAGQELEDLRELPAPDFDRLVLAYSMGVEDGNQFGGDAFMTTLDELAVVYRAMHQKPLPEDLPAEVINVRAGRLLSNGNPQVLPWGAWAEFGQRHIGEVIGDIDTHYRKALALPDRADEIKRFIDQRFRHLTLFPVAASARTVGKGDVADIRFLDDTVDVAIKSPELLTFDFWSWLEKTINYEHRPRRMPQHTVWFNTPSASVPYEASLRIGGAPLPVTSAAFEALIDEAPEDLKLNARAPQLTLGASVRAKATSNIMARTDYDVHALDRAIADATEKAVWRPLQRKRCDLAVSECARYAKALIDEDPAAAAAVYEKAFSNPAYDRIVMSNGSAWLVSYYERTGHLDKAAALAEESGDVGSVRGMDTLARFYERHNRVADARRLFDEAAERYESGRPLAAAFYYRQAVIASRSEYQERWRAAQDLIFPNGLVKTPIEQTAKPPAGVFVDQDSAVSRNVNLRAGDIIVGVDGFGVGNKQQLDTVIAFSESEKPHKFTVWRGALFTVELPASHDMTLKTYPLKGLVP